MTTTTENNASAQLERMYEMRERRKGVAKRQRERYTAQCDANKKRKDARDKNSMASALFKVQELSASLVSAQRTLLTAMHSRRPFVQ